MITLICLLPGCVRLAGEAALIHQTAVKGGQRSVVACAVALSLAIPWPKASAEATNATPSKAPPSLISRPTARKGARLHPARRIAVTDGRSSPSLGEVRHRYHHDAKREQYPKPDRRSNRQACVHFAPSRCNDEGVMQSDSASIAPLSPPAAHEIKSASPAPATGIHRATALSRNRKKPRLNDRFGKSPARVAPSPRSRPLRGPRPRRRQALDRSDQSRACTCAVPQCSGRPWAP